MVLADSVGVPRDPTYSGTLREAIRFRVPGCHRLWPAFPDSSANKSLYDSHVKGPTTPQGKTPAVWASSRSLAATEEIDFSFFSCGYLDVSVRRVGPARLWIQRTAVQESRDQHSFDNSPGLIAVFHALQSLLMPRHPPCALSSLTTKIQSSCHRPSRREEKPSRRPRQTAQGLDPSCTPLHGPTDPPIRKKRRKRPAGHVKSNDRYVLRAHRRSHSAKEETNNKLQDATRAVLCSSASSTALALVATLRRCHLSQPNCQRTIRPAQTPGRCTKATSSALVNRGRYPQAKNSSLKDIGHRPHSDDRQCHGKREYSPLGESCQTP